MRIMATINCYWGPIRALVKNAAYFLETQMGRFPQNGSGAAGNEF